MFTLKTITDLFPTRKNRDAKLIRAFAMYADKTPADLLAEISARQAELEQMGQCKLSSATTREAEALRRKEQELQNAIAAYEAAIADAKRLLNQTKDQASTTLADERVAAANERQEGKAILSQAADLRVLVQAVAANA